MADQKAYYAIIPANVRYDKDLPPNAKLLYGEITALCNEKGFCWASNGYFAELYGASIRSVQNWINALSDKGYIRTQVNFRNGSKIVESRYISIASTYEENFTTPRKNFHEGHEENFTTPHEENFMENNTSSFNTTTNKKKERKTATSYDSILSDIVDDDLRDLYLEYIKMRKLIKAPMTDRALTILISKVNQLEPNDVERQKRLLETSIANNWKSVYPLKDEPKPQKSVGFDLDEFFDAACLDSERKSRENPPKTAGTDDSIRQRAEALKRQLS